MTQRNIMNANNWMDGNRERAAHLKETVRLLELERSRCEERWRAVADGLREKGQGKPRDWWEMEMEVLSQMAEDRRVLQVIIALLEERVD